MPASFADQGPSNSAPLSAAPGAFPRHFDVSRLWARSIKCGKSTFPRDAAGTYGHLGHVAHVTEVALVDHFAQRPSLSTPIEFAGLRVVDETEQSRKRHCTKLKQAGRQPWQISKDSFGVPSAAAPASIELGILPAEGHGGWVLPDCPSPA